MNTVKLASIIFFFLGLLILFSIIYVLLFPTSTTTSIESKPTLEITLYAGEFDTNFGFGLNKTLSSPGPTIKVKLGDTTKIKLINIGKIPHSFAIVEEERYDAKPLFGAFIGSPTKPLLPDQEGEIVFKPNREGTFKYICSVPGHLERGMLGIFIVLKD
ncbi:Copper-containing nitrite reductase [archaeon HR06]|nr:Copper-containing nitrite reductase [archaeon HR06]